MILKKFVSNSHIIIFLFNNLHIAEFSAIYLGPKSAPAQSVPLIVWPHGGPHSAFANGYSIEASMFLKTGTVIFNPIQLNIIIDFQDMGFY